MNKHDINSQNSITMIFNKLYEDTLKKTQKMKQKHDLKKTMREEMIRKLNYQKKLLMKNNLINIQVNKIFSLMLKKEKIRDTEKSSKKLDDKSNKKIIKVNQINKLILKFESLILNFNTLLKKLKH